MNNEEKILQLLSQMQNDFNQRFDKLEAEVGELKRGQTKLSIISETIQHNVEIVAEGHAAIIDKLDKLPDFNKVETEIEVIKSAVSDHSDKFNKLKAL